MQFNFRLKIRPDSNLIIMQHRCLQSGYVFTHGKLSGLTADPDIGNTVTRVPCATLWNETDTKCARTANHNYYNRFYVERANISRIVWLLSSTHFASLFIFALSHSIAIEFNGMVSCHNKVFMGCTVYTHILLLDSLRQHQPIDDRELDLHSYCYTAV